MVKEKSDSKISQKWKSYITGIINPSKTMSSNKIERYFYRPISESTAKAIQENWIRILGIDYEIICMNLCKDGKPLGIALEGKYELLGSVQQISHHFLRAIKPNFCIGMSRKFCSGDELLEVNGLKILGLPTKDVLYALKKVTNNFQIVVARSVSRNCELASDYGGSEENIISPLSFYDTDEDNDSNHTGTLRSITSNYSTTSHDFGSNVSVSDMIDGKYENVREYLRNIDGWRGPVILEFRKQNESLGLALEEIVDPKKSNIIIVFKLVASNMKAGQDGRLHVGDRLLEVNGKSVAGIHFRKVCQWMKSSHGRLVLSICKPHFESTNYNNSDMVSEENMFYHTVDRTKLSKLDEEANPIETPLVPEYLEKQIILRKNNNKLGVFLDIVDNGKNGVRIKRIANGIAKEDGRLHEGDYLVRINDVCLRIDDKNKLGYCLNQISTDSVFSIWYITGEDIKQYKMQCMGNTEVIPPISKLYPDTNSVRFIETSHGSLSIISEDEKPSFRTFDITIENDFQTKLGLLIGPSIRDQKIKSVADIHECSLAEKSQLRINDEILMVNETRFENMSVSEVGQFLKKTLEISSTLDFRIRRMVTDDDDIKDPMDSIRMKLSQLPDIYCLSIKKSGNSYGFSLLELENANGVIVELIHPDSALNQELLFHPGHRFAMVNKYPVIGWSKANLAELVKKSSRRLDLVMERVKYREFLVTITKDSTLSLGLNIGGGIDTTIPIPIIESLVPHNKSKFSEALFSSDYILEVDGTPMIGLTHDEIIIILRSTGIETTFKIYRPLPYIKRTLCDNIESSEFPHDYLHECRYSVTISKPVDTVSTFGIVLTDVVVLNEDSGFAVLARYKAVQYVEQASLAEKYAPQIRPYHFLVAINGVPIDCDISCHDLRQIIDSGKNIELLFSIDIPYRVVDSYGDHDSPVLLRDSQKLSHSDNSSEEDLFVQSNNGMLEADNQNEGAISETSIESENPNYVENVSDPVAEIGECEPESDEKRPGDESGPVRSEVNVNESGEPKCGGDDSEIPKEINNPEPGKMDESSSPGKVEERADVTGDVTDSHVNGEPSEKSEPKENPIDDVDRGETENSQSDQPEREAGHVEPEEPAASDSGTSETEGPISELGINIDSVTLVKLDNVELGFQIYGGLNGGPRGETLPVFVVGAERNSCNWPGDREEPLLKNSTQLIEFNGEALSGLPLSRIEQMIRDSPNSQLVFRVMTFK